MDKGEGSTLAGRCGCCAAWARHLDRRRLLAGMSGVVFAALKLGPAAAQAAPPVQRLCMEARDPHPNEKLVPLLDYKRDVVRLAFTLEQKMLIEFFQTTFPIEIAENSPEVAYDRVTKKVIFGDQYIARFETSNLKLAAILAHETGHAYQVRTDIIRLLENQKNFQVKFVEIHSDYMSGAYSAWRDRRWKDGAKSNRVMGSVFYELGDFFESNPNHHGPKHERWVAFQRGYGEFEEFDWGRGVVPINIVALSGVRYVQNAYF